MERPDPGINFWETYSPPGSAERKAGAQHNSGHHNQAGRWPLKEPSQPRGNPEFQQPRAKAKKGTADIKGWSVHA